MTAKFGPQPGMDLPALHIYDTGWKYDAMENHHMRDEDVRQMFIAAGLGEAAIVLQHTAAHEAKASVESVGDYL